VEEFTNPFHTLHTKMGIKDSERRLVLKYRGALHRYIQTEMDFLDISSLGVAYRYCNIPNHPQVGVHYLQAALGLLSLLYTFFII
jgi:hypothetical protein